MGANKRPYEVEKGVRTEKRVQKKKGARNASGQTVGMRVQSTKSNNPGRPKPDESCHEPGLQAQNHKQSQQKPAP